MQWIVSYIFSPIKEEFVDNTTLYHPNDQSESMQIEWVSIIYLFVHHLTISMGNRKYKKTIQQITKFHYI